MASNYASRCHGNKIILIYKIQPCKMAMHSRAILLLRRDVINLKRFPLVVGTHTHYGSWGCVVIECHTLLREFQQNHKLMTCSVGVQKWRD